MRSISFCIACAKDGFGPNETQSVNIKVTSQRQEVKKTQKLQMYVFYFQTFEKADCTIFALWVGWSDGWCHHFTLILSPM